MSESSAETARRVTLTADIVSAYVSNNHVQSADLAKLLSDVHTAICSVSAIAPAADAAPARATAQEIRRSITHEHLISFEDGKPYKTLRRHLTLRGLTPEQYRAKWGLGPDYPMTSASYSEQRSELARALGLGQQRRKHAAVAAPEAAPASSAAEADAPKKPRASRKKEG
ncbi:MucR family transcriptional regulator [Methylobacterium gnaphalii]|uniref:Transcriptional regulator n=1 Tax=Methylobacterium gnaphalii TaxID=1010610 RepID=A0A512JNR7_9HYPH|nr:MucR family transcriptional regulator [Methylobacterium gnaphalii]GEP11503.1 transcriptional regulator [Methylobacterium gnaphalii]GJD70163.1 Transcriptional regulatory protein ros [Methylobacterium gnaphalii]GLS49507.1 transcriptional regulator [Methylobacterium gnaphalii]